MATNNPDVVEMVRLHLVAGKFDGLYNPGLCACEVDDLAPCGEIQGDCTAGYKTFDKCDEECRGDGACEWHIREASDGE